MSLYFAVNFLFLKHVYDEFVEIFDVIFLFIFFLRSTDKEIYRILTDYTEVFSLFGVIFSEFDEIESIIF